MKLIDVDEFIKNFPIRSDRYDRENGNKHFINGIETVIESLEQAPEIEAIPVRWLEGKYSGSGVYATENYFRKVHAVKDIIQEWKEQKK